MSFLYCEDEDIARLLLALHAIPAKQRKEMVNVIVNQLIPATSPRI